MKYKDIISNLNLTKCELEFNNDEIFISAEFFLCEENLKRIHAFNKLLNVAKYLNGNTLLSLHNKQTFKYSIQYHVKDKKFHISNCKVATLGQVFFKSEDAARKAIKILGEETIKLALGV